MLCLHNPLHLEKQQEIMVSVVSDYIPKWLESLLGEEKFFRPCMVHKFTKKNEKNIFCLECCTTICFHCLPPHRLHSLLQIRRYVYHDVVRLDDAQKLIDCSLVQSYTTNSAKVVFLKQRPMSRPLRRSGNLCVKCDRGLQQPYLFCSLSCKVQHLLALKKATTNNKEQKPSQKCEQQLHLPNIQKPESFSKMADDQITPDSVLDSPVLLSGSTSSIFSGGVENNCTTVLVSFAAATEFVKKKKKKKRNIKKKGVPQRSPLY